MTFFKIISRPEHIEDWCHWYEKKHYEHLNGHTHRDPCINLHLSSKSTKCRWIFHTWILWDRYCFQFEQWKPKETLLQQEAQLIYKITRVYGVHPLGMIWFRIKPSVKPIGWPTHRQIWTSTHPKTNMDTQNSHGWKEIPLPKYHFKAHLLVQKFFFYMQCSFPSMVSARWANISRTHNTVVLHHKMHLRLRHGETNVWLL